MLGGPSVAPLTSTFGYNNNDLPLTRTLPISVSGVAVQELTGYDANSRPITVSASGPTISPVTETLASVYTYTYDALNRTNGFTSTLNGGTQGITLTHDAASRLTSAQVVGSSAAQNWSYDPEGNHPKWVPAQLMTTIGGSNITTTYTYSTSNPLVTVTPVAELATTNQGSVTTTYGYDGSWNTTSIHSTTGLSKTLSHDAQNRLIQVTISGSPAMTVTQSYNAEGQRASYAVTKTNGLTQTQSFTSWGSVLQQRVVVSDTVTGGITSTTTYTDVFVHDNSGAPLELVRLSNGTTSRYWYIEDGRGNVVALVDNTGTVQDRYTYGLWGNLVSSSETVQQPFLYAGYWYDRELGWHWLSVREYDPVLERFLQPDPSFQEGIRSYVYVGDDPIDRTDPSGFGPPVPSEPEFFEDEQDILPPPAGYDGYQENDRILAALSGDTSADSGVDISKTSTPYQARKATSLPPGEYFSRGRIARIARSQRSSLTSYGRGMIYRLRAMGVGVRFATDGEDLRYLTAMQARGNFSVTGKDILLREDAADYTVYEEYLHAMRAQERGWTELDAPDNIEEALVEQ